MTNRDISNIAGLDHQAQLFLKRRPKTRLSARSYMKVIRVALRIADLDESDILTIAHMSEATPLPPPLTSVNQYATLL